MASAARAYRNAAPQRQPRRDVRVLPGSRPASGISEAALRVARIVVVMAVFLAVLGCIRIGFTAATVSTALANEELSVAVSDLQSASANLEVVESSLTNPTHVRSVAAGQLGMVLPEQVDMLAISPDVVVHDEAGNLSLQGSLSVAAQA